MEKTQVIRRRRLPTLPSGVGAATLAVPKACACCLGRGIKAGGDRWQAWVSEKGHQVERWKKTGGWVIGGIVVCLLTRPFGIIALAMVGAVAAAVAGSKVPPGEAGRRERVSDGAPDESADRSALAVPVQSGTAGADPVERPGSVPAVRSDGPAAKTRPIGPVTGPALTGPVPVGPPSTSPLVGRTDPVDVWTDPVRWGLDAYGRPLETVLPGNPGILIGGVSGSGKTVATHQMLCTVALDPNAQLWLVDGKMIELIHYQDIAHAYLGEPDVDAFAKLVAKLEAEKERRKKAIAGKAVKITAANWRTYDAPFTLFHIDEIQIYSMQSKEGEKLVDKLGLLATQCRAFGIFVSIATQRPEDRVVPPFLCTNLTLKLAMRCEDAAQSNTVLGNGMAGKGYRADGFTPDQRGAAYYRGEVGYPLPLTAGYLHIPDEGEDGPDHVRDIVRVAIQLRRAAGTLPGGLGPAEPLKEAAVRASKVSLLGAVLEVLGEGEDRVERDTLAARLGYEVEDLKARLKAAGAGAPRSMRIDGDPNARGWYRRDLEEALEAVTQVPP
ncbi:FtsK/SpoIIIE domain-containing protein [Nocardiopsis sp. FR26]|uniref:FtsK/SpoIIIE domain-containing protein n=1 Tax=Nocardiopsis sp. FR26 TaxID=2605987 RepID=UPI00135BFCEC|nr:FtsK/SpoIIIE domain-containing protein [Nocardiopsis sp. FR26]